MRSNKWVLPFLLLMLFAVPALAAINNSHHDIPVYLAQTGTTTTCFYCHGILDTNAGLAGYGAVGPLCVSRCHTGTGIIGAGTAVQPQAPAVSAGSDTFTRPAANFTIVRFDQTHGDNTAELLNGVLAAASTGTSGYPYAANAQIECTSCHAVHDNINSPFLWAPLADATPGNGFCDRCHGGVAANSRIGNYLSGAPNGNHPIDFTVSVAAASARSEAGAALRPGRRGRLINFDWSSATNGAGVFDVPTDNGTTLSGASGAAQYYTGGHLGNYRSIATAGQQMGCYTCHAAHRPAGADGANNLVVIPTSDVAVGFNPLCTGCHGPTTTWALNQIDNVVGSAAGGFGHPVGANTQYNSIAAGVATYSVSVGGFTFTLPLTTVETANTQPNIQFGAQGEVMCTTCHDIHLGISDSMAIANLGQAAGAAVCNACHNGSELADIQDVGEAGGAGELANAHHRTTTAAIAADYNPGNDAQNLAMNLTWMTPTLYTMGNLGDGLQCADCHQFNGTAHNWPQN